MSVFQTVGGVAECHIYKKIHFVGSKQLFCKHLKMAINDCVLLVNVNLYYLIVSFSVIKFISIF